MPKTTAHSQIETIHLVSWYPEHEVRESDSHYPIFNATRKRLKAAGKLVCWVCGTTENIQLHHNACEFALMNGVDVGRFAADHPDFNITDDESFYRMVESEGALLALCQPHHTGRMGIHVCPYPGWSLLRYEKASQPAFVEVRPASAATVTFHSPADSTVTVAVDAAPVDPTVTVAVDAAPVDPTVAVVVTASETD